MPIEKIIEGIGSDKLRFEYQVILCVRRYYDNLLEVIRRRYEQMLEERDYLRNYRRELRCQ